MDADKLAVDFGTKGEAQQVIATGSVQTERELKGEACATRQRFEPGTVQMGAGGEWTRINLHGNVRLKEGDRGAEVGRSNDDARPANSCADRQSRSPRCQQRETHAAKMTFYQESGNLQAEGNVRSSDFSSKSGNVQLSAEAQIFLQSI